MNQTKEEKMKELKNVVIYTKDHCPFSKRVKEYLTSEIVEEYSTLNPIVELEKSRAITSKG